MGGLTAARKGLPGTEKRKIQQDFLPARWRITVSLAKAKKTGQDPAMNASAEMSFEDMLRVKLQVLRREHRDLDEAIHALELTGRPDQLTLRRLKKQKLALKDQIVKIEDRLIPDIIA